METRNYFQSFIRCVETKGYTFTFVEIRKKRGFHLKLYSKEFIQPEESRLSPV